MIDFHAHILPGIDDGSRDTDMSLRMLREEAAQGVTDVVATPHFYAERTDPDAFLQARHEALRLLQAAEGEEAGGLPRVLPGAEVLYFSGISHAEALPQLALGERVLLLEMPMAAWTEAVLREVEAVRSQRELQVVLAHIERYLPWQPDAVWQRLRSAGVLFQCNAECFCGRFPWRSMRMLREGMVDILGTDCHNMTSRPPNLGRCMDRIRRKAGESAAEQLIGHARWLLDGCRFR